MNTADPKHSGITAPLRHLGRAVAVVAALLALAGAALAATGGAGAGKFAAELDARAVADPTIEACRAFGEGGQKIEARYEGTFTVPAEFMPAEFRPAEFKETEFRLPLQLSLEILYDRSTGVGTAQGMWQVGDPTASDAPTEFVARGELLAVVSTTESAELQLDGMLAGSAQSSAVDSGVLAVLFNFTTKIGDGATFPHLKGTVGDPSVADPTVGDPSVGDPTGLGSNPAALVPAVKC